MNAENKILLVDDEKDIVELMEEVLQKKDFTQSKKPVPAGRHCRSAGTFSPM